MIAVPVDGPNVAVLLDELAKCTMFGWSETQVAEEVTSLVPSLAVNVTAGPPLVNFPAVPHGVMARPLGVVADTVSDTPL